MKRPAHTPDVIGERLKALRKTNAMTISILAAHAKVPASTISAVETGQRAGARLSIQTARHLAKALGVSMTVFCAEE